eukprot:7931682-Ditylum_brightwellii.AAC.1
MKFDIVIDHAVGAPGHDKDAVDGSNAVDNSYLNKMMFKMYNLGSKHTAKDMMAHSCTPRKSISYAIARAKRENNAKYKVMHYNVQEKNSVKHKY